MNHNSSDLNGKNFHYQIIMNQELVYDSLFVEESLAWQRKKMGKLFCYLEIYKKIKLFELYKKLELFNFTEK